MDPALVNQSMTLFAQEVMPHSDRSGALCDAIEYFNFGPDLRAGRSGRDPSQVRPTLRWREPDSNHRSHERRPAWSWCRVSSRRLFRSPGIKQRRHEPSRTFRGTRYRWFESGSLQGLVKQA